MSSFSDWKVPAAFQPKSDEYVFDLENALASVLYISSVVPENAFSAATLGTERAGNAVLIRESGLVLTVGYLVNEAQSVWLRTGDGKVLPADVVGMDHTTGFALVQALGRLDIPAIPLGDSDTVQIGDEVVLAGAGGPKRSVGAHVAARQPFAGYWEYLLENAIFTAPSHPNWGGAALIGPAGTLVGIGSLQLEQERRKGISETINMSIPINLLKPVIEDILTMGQPNRPPRPWLGVYATEIEGKVVLMGVADRSPAKRADLRAGDVILSLNGSPVVNLAAFFKRLWGLGAAGVEAPLSILRDGRTLDVTVVSADRNRIANNPRLH
jgi:S1-C subfamily serine protease